MTAQERRRRWHWPTLSRDTGLVLFGAWVIFHEVTTATREPELAVILAGLSLMGVPLAARRDERDKK